MNGHKILFNHENKSLSKNKNKSKCHTWDLIDRQPHTRTRHLFLWDPQTLPYNLFLNVDIFCMCACIYICMCVCTHTFTQTRYIYLSKRSLLQQT